MQSPSHAKCAATLSGQDIGTSRRMQNSALETITTENQIEAAALAALRRRRPLGAALLRKHLVAPCQRCCPPPACWRLLSVSEEAAGEW